MESQIGRPLHDIVRGAGVIPNATQRGAAPNQITQPRYLHQLYEVHPVTHSFSQFRCRSTRRGRNPCSGTRRGVVTRLQRLRAQHRRIHPKYQTVQRSSSQNTDAALCQCNVPAAHRVAHSGQIPPAHPHSPSGTSSTRPCVCNGGNNSDGNLRRCMWDGRRMRSESLHPLIPTAMRPLGISSGMIPIPHCSRSCASGEFHIGPHSDAEFCPILAIRAKFGGVPASRSVGGGFPAMNPFSFRAPGLSAPLMSRSASGAPQHCAAHQRSRSSHHRRFATDAGRDLDGPYVRTAFISPTRAAQHIQRCLRAQIRTQHHE